MATPAAFSRLQLAAALIEYDNDPNDPDAPRRSAQQSAIFAHFRRNPAARPDIAGRKSNFLGVSLPSEGGTATGRESAIPGTRRSRRLSKASTIALRNPFGVDGQTEMELNEEDEEQELEVDLQSWGLDTFMPKDKKTAKAKGKEQVGTIRSKLGVPEPEPAAQRGRGVVTSRSMNLEGQFEFENATIVDRRRSVGTPLELLASEEHEVQVPRRRAASRASLLSHADPTSLLPFPTSPVRSPSPDADLVPSERDINAQDRRYSTASLGSRIMPENHESRQRRQSMTSIGMGMMFSEDGEDEEENPFAIKRPAATSRFDPKSTPSERPRSQSNASLGSRIMLDNDGVSMMTGDPYPRDRPYSTMELLRPKVLVMPSPLQSAPAPPEPLPDHRVVAGFESSRDGPPLPPGARVARRLSSTFSNGPLPSNAFTPNPMLDLTPSQNLFRNTLVVGGVTSHLDSQIPRAKEDGEQIVLDPVVPEVEVPVIIEEPPPQNSHPAGKLYGRSLIDQLESRKQEMRGRQRVFRGDERPSMMARGSSTLIDPATLKSGPQRMSSFDPQNNLTRRGSQTMKPLLTFDSEENLSPNRPPLTSRGARSVFGTDLLWEREVEKLKAIQAREAEEAKERQKREDEEHKKGKKGKKAKKENKLSEIEQPVGVSEPEPVFIEPATLPDIPRVSTGRPQPKPEDLDEETDSEDDDDNVVPTNSQKAHKPSDSWHAGASDEEDDGPRRTTGIGLRRPTQRRKPTTVSALDDDSEEDVPLAATVHKAIARATMAAYQQEDSDEDKPLAQVIQKAQLSPHRPAINKALISSGNNSDDDDQPLGLRASRIPSMVHGGNDENDDVPLAFHPEQQRRTQYQMFSQQQAQQQMMMQAQMQNSMYMNAQASMMGSIYGLPPVMGQMPMMPMQPPMLIPSPPPSVDEAKFGRVDRWRRDVAVDGEQ